MPDDFLCPDCGGIIGASEVTDAGRPCTCFSPPTSADTAVLTSPTEVKKICCVCGTDVTGKKRLKDHRGYWCYACHKSDEATRKGLAAGETLRHGGVVCPDCGRAIARADVVEVRGNELCARCARKRKEFDVKSKGRLRRLGRSQQYATNSRLQKLIFVMIILGAVAMWRFDLLPFQESSGSATRDLLAGARVLAMVFLALMIAVIWWVKRNV